MREKMNKDDAPPAEAVQEVGDAPDEGQSVLCAEP